MSFNFFNSIANFDTIGSTVSMQESSYSYDDYRYSMLDIKESICNTISDYNHMIRNNSMTGLLENVDISNEKEDASNKISQLLRDAQNKKLEYRMSVINKAKISPEIQNMIDMINKYENRIKMMNLVYGQNPVHENDICVSTDIISVGSSIIAHNETPLLIGTPLILQHEYSDETKFGVLDDELLKNHYEKSFIGVTKVDMTPNALNSVKMILVDNFRKLISEKESAYKKFMMLSKPIDEDLTDSDMCDTYSFELWNEYCDLAITKTFALLAKYI